MSRAWLEQRERGTPGALRLIASITSSVGYGAGRALLYPIALYFVVFSTRARAASRAFLARALGRAAGWRDVFRHYHTFASTLLDRIELLSGRVDRFEIAIHGRDALDAALTPRASLDLPGDGWSVIGSRAGSPDDNNIVLQRGRGFAQVSIDADGNASLTSFATTPNLVDGVRLAGDGVRAIGGNRVLRLSL